VERVGWGGESSTNERLSNGYQSVHERQRKGKEWISCKIRALRHKKERKRG